MKLIANGLTMMVTMFSLVHFCPLNYSSAWMNYTDEQNKRDIYVWPIYFQIWNFVYLGRQPAYLSIMVRCVSMLISVSIHCQHLLHPLSASTTSTMCPYSKPSTLLCWQHQLFRCVSTSFAQIFAQL